MWPFVLCCRCEIPECDSPNPAEQTYQTEWLGFTTPFKEDGRLPRKCQRYAPLSGPMGSNGTRCARSEFDVNTTEKCYGRWVFEDQENTIGTEVRVWRNGDRGVPDLSGTGCTCCVCLLFPWPGLQGRWHLQGATGNALFFRWKGLKLTWHTDYWTCTPAQNPGLCSRTASRLRRSFSRILDKLNFLSDCVRFP